MGKSVRAWFVVWMVCAAMLTGCKRSTEHFGADTQTYEVKGTVVAKDPLRGELTLKHEAIPGFMDAMTMPYRLMFGEELSELHEGDVIRARLVVKRSKDGDVTNVHLDEIAVLAQSHQSFKPAAVYNVPSPGQPLVDFGLVNQDAKPIHLGQFQGKALLITFIYTRCPIGDFCPRMSKNFAAIQAALHSDPELLEKTQLLSISFDPAFDTPAVLRSYGTQYVGAEGFQHWQFAMAPVRTLPQMEHYFNVGVTGQDAALTHSLSTILVDPSGKIAAWYPGNEWQPADVVAKIRSILQPVPAQVRVAANQAKEAGKENN